MYYIYRYVEYCPKAETDEDLIQGLSDYYDTSFYLRYKSRLDTTIALCNLIKSRKTTPWIYKVSLDDRKYSSIKPRFMLEITGEKPLFFDFRSLTNCERYQAALESQGIKSKIVPIQKNMIKPSKKR